MAERWLAKMVRLARPHARFGLVQTPCLGDGPASLYAAEIVAMLQGSLPFATDAQGWTLSA